MAKNTDYETFLRDYGANSERLHRVGIHSFGYGPGHLVIVDDNPHSISLSQCIVDKICMVIKVAYPETRNDKAMIKAYQKRLQKKKPSKPKNT